MDKTKKSLWAWKPNLFTIYIGTKVASGCELISYFHLIPTLAPRQKHDPLCLRSHAGLLSLWCCSNFASNRSDSKLLGGEAKPKIVSDLDRADLSEQTPVR